MTWFWVKHLVRGIANWIEGKITFTEMIYSHWSCMWAFTYCLVLPLLLIATAILTHHERAIIADIQFRKGPRKIGSGGLLQPFADAFKLLAKEHISVRFLREYVFEIASVSSFIFAAFLWVVLPLGSEIITCADDYGLVWTFNISLFHVFCIILAGWSSYSKYANLGSYRTSAQLVSYELIIGTVFSALFSMLKDLNILTYLQDQFIVGSFSYFLPALGISIFISTLAESCRHPFDLPEAEAELVSGYNVEYSSIRFAMFFLAEYLSLIFSAFLINDLIFGESFSIILYLSRTAAIIYIVVFIRSLIPRYRYDHLMSINWKVILPMMSSYLFYFIYLQNFVL